ncbi:MAG: response regulator [Cyanobacteria bacterium J06626_14]
MTPFVPRILIAEDEQRIVSFLEKGLRQQGYETVSTGQGDRTIQLILENGFDLVLLDLGLPVKSGWAVLNEIEEADRSIPVIIITAQEGVGDRLNDVSTNISSYLVTPFRFSVLLDAIRECFASDELGESDGSSDSI